MPSEPARAGLDDLRYALDLPDTADFDTVLVAIDQRIVQNAVAADVIPAGDKREWLNRLAAHDFSTDGGKATARADRAKLLSWRDKAKAATPRLPADPAPAPTAPALPKFIASGLDPAILLSVPEPVRPVMAAAKTPAEAYRLLQEYGGATDIVDVEVRAMVTGDNDVAEAARQWRNDQTERPLR